MASHVLPRVDRTSGIRDPLPFDVLVRARCEVSTECPSETPSLRWWLSTNDQPCEGVPRMDVHKNARTTPHSRALIAQRVAAGETPAVVARAVGVSDRTVHKWVARAAEDPLALEDRSCRPRRSPRAISAGLMVEIQ